MIDETFMKSLAFSAQDLFTAARWLESCGQPGVGPDVLDEAEGELIVARNAVEDAVASILLTFGVHADVELHRIIPDGVE
jgi:hypothetical protein